MEEKAGKREKEVGQTVLSFFLSLPPACPSLAVGGGKVKSAFLRMGRKTMELKSIVEAVGWENVAREQFLPNACLASARMPVLP